MPTLAAPFRLKPWYIGMFTAGRWVTTYPWINLPKNVDPAQYPWIVAHETVHLDQQKAMGFWKWLWKYYTSRAFRLDQEADGVVAEYEELVKQNRYTPTLFGNYAKDFASSAYLWCASSVEQGLAILQAKLNAKV